MSEAPNPGHRDGATYDAARDYAALNAQMGRVFHEMKDGAWHTLRELAILTDDSEASISARLRDLRKEKFGAWTVERKCEPGRVWWYRLSRG